MIFKNPLLGNISGLFISKDRKTILAFAFVFMVVTTIPYFIGYQNQGDEWRFSGFVFGVEDGNSYIAKMLRGSEGDWLFRTPYTSQEQSGVLAYFSYLVLGKLTSSPGKHEQLVVLFHLYRIVAGIAAIIATYDFTSIFIEKKHLRFLGLIIACLGGGLGYIFFILGSPWWLGNLPLEFYSPESFGFLILFGLPHLAFTRALFLWGLYYYLRTDIKKGGILSGLLWLIMGLFQPLTITLAWAIICVHLFFIGILQIKQVLVGCEVDLKIIHWWSLRVFGAVCISLPLVVYTIIAFNIDPVVREWTAQNLTHSPHPIHYLIAYGLLLPFAIRGVLILVKSDEVKNWLLPTWFLLFPFLVYLPFNLQRRLAEGFWVALTILFLVTMERATAPLKKIGQLCLTLTIPSSFIIFTGAIIAVVHPTTPLFRPSDEVEVFQFLTENVEEDSIILCAYETGNVLPAWSVNFVVIGHGPESVGIKEISPAVEAFYKSSTSDLFRIEILNRWMVRYVFWGPSERRYGDWDPSTEDYLELFHKQNGFEIYRVK